jgi:S1-C subfamily serine protease
MSIHTLYRFAFFLGSLLLSLAVSAQTLCPNFEPQPMGTNEIINEFGGAVFRLENKDPLDTGTGYLIDSIQGYVLTAAHVVRDSVADPRILVKGTTPSLPGKTLKLKLIGSLKPNIDLALLQVTDLKSVAAIRPLDISLRLPTEDAHLVVMGYPKLGDEPNKVLKHQEVIITTSDQDGLIEVRQASFPGNSGGPLIDMAGTAVGICVTEVGEGSTLARYIPMADAEPLLNKIHVSKRMTELEANLRSGAATRDDLNIQLKKRTDHPSNLELYGWALQVSRSMPQYATEPFLSYFRCPIVPAYFHRRIDDAALLLKSVADPKITGQIFKQIAEREAKLGRPATALEDSKEAVENFFKAGDILGEAESLLLTGKLQTNLGFYGDAARNLNQANDLIQKLDDRELWASVLIQLGALSAKRGQMDAAHNYLSQAEAVSNNIRTKGDATFFSAQLDSQEGKYENAEKSLRGAISSYGSAADIDPTESSRLYFRLGQVQLAKGDKEGAVASFHKYLEISPYGIFSVEAHGILNKFDDVKF